MIDTVNIFEFLHQYIANNRLEWQNHKENYDAEFRKALSENNVSEAVSPYGLLGSAVGILGMLDDLEKKLNNFASYMDRYYAVRVDDSGNIIGRPMQQTDNDIVNKWRIEARRNDKGLEQPYIEGFLDALDCVEVDLKKSEVVK